MLSKYIDSILIVLSLAVGVLFWLVISLLKKNKKSEQKNNLLQDENRLLNEEIKSINILNAKVSLSNVDRIWCLEEKMDQVHHILRDVLFVSKLITNEKGETNTAAVIEELRRSVQYAEQLAKRQINEADFYKGD